MLPVIAERMHCHLELCAGPAAEARHGVTAGKAASSKAHTF